MKQWKNMQRSRRRKNNILIIFVVLVLSIVMPFSILAKEPPKIKAESPLGNSNSRDIVEKEGKLAKQQIKSTSLVEFKPAPLDKVLYQFRYEGTQEQNDLQIILALAGNVDTVTMTAPDGNKVDKLVPFPENDMENEDFLDIKSDSSATSKRVFKGSAITATDDLTEKRTPYPYRILENKEYIPEPQKQKVQPFSSPAKTTLGTSKDIVLGFSELKSQKIDDSKILDTKSTVAFFVQEEGVYSFELYDNKNQRMTQLTYHLSPYSIGDLTLDTISSNEHFKVVGNTQLRLAYTPSGLGETLCLALPPYFTFNSIPENQPGVTYEQVSRYPFPKEYYEGTPHSEILLDEVENNPANYQGQALVIKFSPTVKERISLSITISPSYDKLAQLMVLYGENPDKIPLKTIATVTAGGSLRALRILEETSQLTNDSGAFPEHYDPTINQYNARVFLPLQQEYAVLRAPENTYFSALSPHYPITDVTYYSPFPINDPSHLLSGETLVYLEGIPYLKLPVSTDTTAGQDFLHYHQTANATQALDARLAEITALAPGMTFEVEDFLVGYTYKGETFLEPLVQAGTVTIPNHYIPEIKTLETGAVGGFYERAQGSENVSMSLDFQNYAPGTQTLGEPLQNILPSVYEEGFLYTKFPYEISPTSLMIGRPTKGSTFPEMQDALREVYYKTHTGHSGTVPAVLSGTQYVATFPKDKGNIIYTEIRYDVIGIGYYSVPRFTVDFMETDDTGAPLAPRHETEITVGIGTPSGYRTDKYATSSPLHTLMEEKEYSRTWDYALLAREDGLRFGTYGDRVLDPNDPGRDTSSYRLTNKGVALAPISSQQWDFGFKSVSSTLRDYKNVKIVIAPEDTDGIKALSKIQAVKTSLFNESMSKNPRVTYYSNKNPQGKTLYKKETNHDFINLELETGEYPEEIVLELEVLYGANIAADVPEFDQGHRIFTRFNRGITFLMEDSRYFYGQTPEKKEEISPSFKGALRATVSTDTPAQYIDGHSDPSFVNDTALGFVEFTFYDELNLHLQRHTVSSSIGSAHYQNSVVRFPVSLSKQIRKNDSSANESILPELFASYEHDVYFELAEGFEMVSLEGYQLKDVVNQSSGNKIFIFSLTAAVPPATPKATVYVLPNAPVGSQRQMIVNSGMSFDSFINNQMQPPDGPDAYYNKEPFLKMLLTSTNPTFPSHWELENMPVFQHNGNFTMPAVNIDRANIDRIVLNPVVEDTIFPEKASFFDHQKNALKIHGWMANISPESTITNYNASYYLPRIGRDTIGALKDGKNETFKNDFNLYLSGPISFGGQLPDTLTTTYLDINGNPLTVDENSSIIQWARVAQVDVSFKNFLPDSNYQIIFPLYTDKSKTGKNTSDLSAYMGAVSTKQMEGEEFSALTYTDPGQFVFESYSLNFKMGLDTLQTGQLDLPEKDIGIAKIYYKENGESKLLATYTNDINKAKCNADVEKITVEPFNPDHFRLTKQHYYPNANADSDFPRKDIATLPITSDFLKNPEPNTFDAAFIHQFNIDVPDMILEIGENGSEDIQVTPRSERFPTTPAITWTSDELANIQNQAVAGITLLGDTVHAVGKEYGILTYSVKITNRLGDEFIGNNFKVRVPRPYGNVEITITADNIWKSHGDPVVPVCLECTDGNLKNHTHYSLISLAGGTHDVDTLLTHRNSDTVTVLLEEIPIGEYDISALTPVRFQPSDGGGSKNITVQREATTPVSFTFTGENHKYLSDTDKGTFYFSFPER